MMEKAQNLKDFHQIQHFIWDFDGTLFDSYPVIIQNLRDALAQFGYDAEPIQIMRLMLDNAAAALLYYARLFHIPPDELNAVYRSFQQQANRKLSARPMRNVRQVLQVICSSGRNNFVFTHRKIPETLAYFEKYHLAQFFQDIVGPETPGFERKPAPNGILCLLRKFHLNPQETVMVGDRRIDMISGRSAGICTAHFVCSAVPESLECDWEIQNFAQMKHMLGP